MKLYNTLTRQVEPFEPQIAGQVLMYTCGPTVYDYYHIGNLRNAVFNDTLRRTLEIAGYQVKHVMNITDVGHLVSDADEGQDKLEKGALREGKTVWEVAEHYTEAFKRDMTALSILPPNGYSSPKYKDSYARATEFIDQQIEMIRLMLDKRFAYETSQAIYFDVTKLPDYGILSGQRLSDKEVGARSDVVTDSDKRSPYDFAVWFFATGRYEGHTMQWESPWGSGFPGWHLECSAIIHATLGDPIDIHTGGVDHIGTHHPNEMAQTEAAFGHPLARYWVHNEFVLVDGAKMAKSKGGAYTLSDVVKKGYDPLAYRLLVLQAHYKSELNFTWEALDSATSRLQGLRALAVLRYQNTDSTNGIDESELDYYKEGIENALADDLNTPEALATLSSVDTVVAKQGLAESGRAAFGTFLAYIDEAFGLDLSSQTDIDDSQKQLIAEREKARTSKDWAKSDELRDKLAQQGILLNDTQHGPIWSRT
jgi:cysteinyl-tRNA synthetase